jgi:hypothetical protein
MRRVESMISGRGIRHAVPVSVLIKTFKAVGNLLLRLSLEN